MNTSNVQDLEEEVVHLREKQAEMEQKVDEANHRLAIALGEVASLWQVVEAMQEQLFPTPSHLQRPASWQAFALTQLASVKSGSTPVGGPVKSGRGQTKEESRGLDKRLVRPELVTAWIQRLRITSVDPLCRFRSR